MAGSRSSCALQRIASAMQALGRTRHAALLQEHVEHHEQVEVQIARTLPFSALGTALDLVASGKAKGRVVLEVV